MPRLVFGDWWRSLLYPVAKKTSAPKFKLKRSYWKLYVAVLVLAVAVPVGLVMLQNAGETEAAWFDQSWGFRKKIPISNSSGSTQTDFQIQLTLDTSALVTAGKLQNDCDDLRFTDIGGKVLGYWLEPGTCNSATTKVWVKVPSIPTSGTDIYFYYGNANSSSQSSTALTFIREIDGVVGAWNMDEASWNGTAGEVKDSSGGGNNGVSVGGASVVSGKFGNAGNFDGADDYINLGSYLTNQNKSKLSISLWVKADQVCSGNAALISKSSNLYIHCWDGYFSYAALAGNGSGGAAATGVYPTNQWLFLVMTYDSTTNSVKSYIDGVHKGSGSFNGQPIVMGSSSFSIGRRTNYYDGLLDNIRIYENTLSLDDVTELYGDGNNRHGYTTANYPGKELIRKYNTSITIGTIATEEIGEGPVAYWKFDEGQGNIAYDSSSGKHNGSISGATWLTEEHCVSGKCLQFDGTNDTVNTGYDFGWDEANKVSISMWINPEDVNSGRRAVIGKKYPDYEWVIYQEAAALKLEYWTSSGGHTNGMASVWQHTLESKKWIHVSYTWDGLTNRFYINGNLVNSHTSTNPSLNQDRTNAMMIGGNIYSWADTYFKGAIDEVKVYSYVRSDAQIREDFVIGGNAAGAQQQNYLSDGLLGYWKMDEGSWNGTAGEVKDSSGNGRHGVRVGDAAIGSGKYGNGGSVDGTGDYISVPYHGDVDYFSASVWAYYPTQASYEDDEGLFGTGTSINFQVRRTNTSSNSWRFEIIGENNVASSSIGSCLLTGMSLDAWNFYTVTYDGKTMRGYINGQQKCSLEVNIGPVRKNNANFFIGNRAGADGFNGKLDEMRIYNRALSNAEIQDLYNYAPKPMAYWKFDEGVGTTAADSSGNGNNGTLNNSASWDVGKVGKAVKLNFDADLNQTVAIPTLNHNYAFTKMAWVKPVTISGCDEARCSIVGPYFEFSGTTLQYYDNGLSTKGWHTGGLSALNTWQHVAVSYDGFSTLRMYIDGKEIRNTAVTNVGNHYSNVIGGFSGTARNFRGLIDEVKIYNYERTPGQIFEDMGGQLELGSSGNAFPQPIAHYKFDELSGQTVNNSGLLGTDLNGTLGANTSASTDDPTWKTGTECKSNGCLSFDGSNDEVDISSPNIIGSSSDFTISVWIKTTDSVGALYGEFTNDGLQTRNYLTLSSGKIQFDQYNPSGGYLTSNSLVNDNQWHHIIYTQSGKTRKIFIDGVLDITDSNAETFTGTTPTIGRIGIRGSASPQGYAGLMDEFKIYNSSFSEDKVKQDMNGGSIVSYGSSSVSEGSLLSDGAGAPPIAEWKFDEKQGTTTADSSGNGHQATFGGTPTWITGKIGAALDFSKNADCVTTTGVPVGSTWTINAWSEFPLQSNGGWHTLLRAGGNHHHILVNSAGEIGTYYNSWSGSGFDTDTLSGWHYVTAVGSDGTTKFYIDGRYVGTSSAVETGNITQIGGICGSQYWGKLDNITVYNYARSQSQIAYDYNRGAPVAHWKFDECQGNTINDSSGNGLSGILTIGSSGSQNSIGTCTTSGSAWNNGSTGKYGSSMNFDGTDDSVSIPDTTNSVLDSSNISIAFWVKGEPYDGSFEGVMSKASRNNTYAGPWTIMKTDTGFRFTLNGSNTLVADFDYQTKWTHVVFTYDGSTVKAFIDSVIKNQQNYSSSINSSDDAIILGLGYGTASNRHFRGMLDDVRIYNYALSPDQVKQVMNEGSAVRYGN